MITDYERREVARRLRGIDAERLDRVYGMDGEGGECSDPDMAKAGRNLMLGAIAEAVGLHYAPYYFDAAPLRDRLADLIEPPRQCPYYDSDRHYCSIHDVPAMDRDALLELVKELELGAQCFVGRKWPDVECERAGKHLADDYEMIARRIREALGASE